jgi:predicted nucleotidyltransferase
MTVTVEQMARGWRARSAALEARAQKRAQRLKGLLPEARRVLVEVHGARRVRLFGSLANGDYNGRSDVDLAVEGLASDEYFEALAELMELFDAPVDLVQLESARPSLRDRIAAEGLVL